jgi:hypothetical protein
MSRIVRPRALIVSPSITVISKGLMASPLSAEATEYRVSPAGRCTPLSH